jgi:hypothetical protein
VGLSKNGHRSGSLFGSLDAINDSDGMALVSHYSAHAQACIARVVGESTGVGGRTTRAGKSDIYVH